MLLVALRPEELTPGHGNFVVKTSRPLALVEKLEFTSVITVYSLWAGNLDPTRRKREAEEYMTLDARPGSRLLHIHTSGHADLKTLKLLNALRPKVSFHCTQSTSTSSTPTHFRKCAGPGRGTGADPHFYAERVDYYELLDLMEENEAL